MENKVLKTITSHDLLRPGEVVLCAVSGGADSVALLLCLYELRDTLGIRLRAAHFNHHIRGEEADRDEEFVRDLCKKIDVECVTGGGDVPAYAKEQGYTLEQAARILRYEFLEAQGADKIAVAHHMDDQAESVLMHIIRGSGTHGIAGMRYVRGKIIRPLLGIRRREIEKYLAEKNVFFCTDTTNLIEDGTRNKLRLSIIPEITERINPGFTESLCHMADIVRTDDDYLCAIAARELDECRKNGGFLRERIAALDEPIRRRALRLAMNEAGAFADIEQKHVEAVEKLLTARTGARLDLPHIVAYNSYDIIRFSNDKNCATIQSEDICIPFSVGEHHFGTLTISVSEAGRGAFKTDAHTSCVDASKIPADAVFRTRKAGDRIHPVGAGGSKKLKDFFIDKKVERDRRDVPLLCSGNEVLCVIGMCVSEKAAVDGGTEKIIKISVEG